MASTIKGFYHLNDNEDKVIIKITINKKQLGTTKLVLDNQVLAEEEGSFSHVLGINQSLDGRELDIYTTCTDINPDTNRLMVTIEIEGGIINRSWTLYKEVKEFGTHAFYGSVTFNL